jgi:hypothetical protein
VKTEVVLASQLQERVINYIASLRNPDAMPNYRKELARYKRRLGKRKEQQITETGLLEKKTRVGFVVTAYDRQMAIYRPKAPQPKAWHYIRYDRSMGFTTHAEQVGLLADAFFNRDILPGRVWEYAEEMRAGNWRDLLSDPITITDDGQVINGQHRLAAASRVDWSEVTNDPAFLVVFGVDPTEAAYADGSRRTARDERVIRDKLLKQQAVS